MRNIMRWLVCFRRPQQTGRLSRFSVYKTSISWVTSLIWFRRFRRWDQKKTFQGNCFSMEQDFAILRRFTATLIWALTYNMQTLEPLVRGFTLLWILVILVTILIKQKKELHWWLLLMFWLEDLVLIQQKHRSTRIKQMIKDRLLKEGLFMLKKEALSSLLLNMTAFSRVRMCM